MSNVAIRVQGISKCYQLGRSRARYKSLRESLSMAARIPFGLSRNRTPTRNPATFWALDDVTFEIEFGGTVGIIGRNGAGKSTLLKVLSRVTEPTKGLAMVFGRVGSLLEVGTGFHPELSGRENVFLNGAILGMSRVEIRRKFDEIVAFAELERFVDTPVKRYSSGMYMRLAFSVAAHLDPEVLMVDEVLAVGDANFQKKCLGKMEEVGESGRTVVFVSHNISAVTRLCDTALLLEAGRLVDHGETTKVVETYLQSDSSRQAQRTWTDGVQPGDDTVRLCSARVVTLDTSSGGTVRIDQAVGIEVTYEVLQPGRIILPNLHFYNSAGVLMFVANDTHPDWMRSPKDKGTYRSVAWVPPNFFNAGPVSVNVACATSAPVLQKHFVERDAVVFDVVEANDRSGARGDYGGDFPGIVRPKLTWVTDCLPSDRSRSLWQGDSVLSGDGE